MKTLALGQENGQLNLLAGLTFSDADGLSILATILHHLFIYTWVSAGLYICSPLSLLIMGNKVFFSEAINPVNIKQGWPPW